MVRATIVVGMLTVLVTARWLVACTEQAKCRAEPVPEADSVEAVLGELQEKAAALRFYQCKLDYIVRQPLLESQARRKGVLHYARFDSRSYLRIDFNTLQYDEEAEQEYREQYLFDGVWLTYVNYEGRSVQRQQMAEPNEPVDAFSLVSRRVPILGFSKVEDLRNQFDIELLGADEGFWRLRMDVRPDSVYRDDYVTIDFQIDKKHGLPAKVAAVTGEQDVHEIALIEAQVNKEVGRSIFDLDIPRDFSVETIPLQRSAGRTSG
jgi:outer membrane lipoprotein-sorting protein